MWELIRVYSNNYQIQNEYKKVAFLHNNGHTRKCMCKSIPFLILAKKKYLNIGNDAKKLISPKWKLKQVINKIYNNSSYIILMHDIYKNTWINTTFLKRNTFYGKGLKSSLKFSCLW